MKFTLKGNKIEIMVTSNDGVYKIHSLYINNQYKGSAIGINTLIGIAGEIIGVNVKDFQELIKYMVAA